MFKKSTEFFTFIALYMNTYRVATIAFGIKHTPKRTGSINVPSFVSSRFMTASGESLSPSQNEITENGVYIVDAMPKPLPKDLKNTYFLLRHGQSEGNVEGVISSARSLATSSKHGLTPLGYDQGKASASKLLELIEEQQKAGNTKSNKVFFYSSPFSRAKQTAEACLDGIENVDAKVQALGLDVQKNIIMEAGIMERFFGDLDAEPLSTYGYVWPNDMKDPTQTGYNVESVAAVSTRLREVVMRIEESNVHKESKGDIIVLTSHADVLQIMQTYASGLDNVGEFSSYRFGNGEVRFMGRTPETLPEPQPLEPPTEDA